MSDASPIASTASLREHAGDLLAHMILSHRYKFIFFCNGRTGSTSIEHALAKFQEGAEYNIGAPGLFVATHVPPATLQGLLPVQVWSDYFKFVFVRNPWDWVLSQWAHNVVKPATEAGGRDLRGTPERPLTAQDIDWLHAGLRQYRALPGAPSLQQSSYAHDPDGNRLVDFVGKFENLEADFRKAMDRLGIRAALPHLNPGDRPADFRRCYGADGWARVGELWAVDIERFGYR
jgi:hypothetical protein